jgi:hypothetical protein
MMLAILALNKNFLLYFKRLIYLLQSIRKNPDNLALLNPPVGHFEDLC